MESILKVFTQVFVGFTHFFLVFFFYFVSEYNTYLFTSTTLIVFLLLSFFVLFWDRTYRTENVKWFDDRLHVFGCFCHRQVLFATGATVRIFVRFTQKCNSRFWILRAFDRLSTFLCSVNLLSAENLNIRSATWILKSI